MLEKDLLATPLRKQLKDIVISQFNPARTVIMILFTSYLPDHVSGVGVLFVLSTIHH
jgi:hypothetical protein